MNSFPTSHFARLGLGLVIITLAGCASSQPVAAIGVSSPPPPLVGSAPIAAYDDFARAVAPAVNTRVETVAQLGTR